MFIYSYTKFFLFREVEGEVSLIKPIFSELWFLQLWSVSPDVG